MITVAERLHKLLNCPGLLAMPSYHDALSAKLCEQAGFETAFMSGFSVSASRLRLPDTGLICYAEMLNQAQNICNAVSIPI